MPVHSYQIVDQKIRAPREHGKALIIPSRSEIPSVWADNLSLLNGHEFSIQGKSISSIRENARQHLISEASKYTSQYRDVSNFASTNIILSGHQPKLFHPGVWFKNFALSSLGKQLSATPINMIVDNDLCELSSVAVPKSVSMTEATTESIAYDTPGKNLPFESREILDHNLFRSFADRLDQSINPTITRPLVHQLWKNTEEFIDPANRLGNTIAAARHQLEGQYGLQTLEIPLSIICQSLEFSEFVAEILLKIEDFQKVHNDSLNEYRAVHRIRSNSHPVPSLNQIDNWFETPFWIWSEESPIRRALYVSRNKNRLVLSNRHDIEFQLDGVRLADQLIEVAERQIAIRPRALMTTMYSRMILSNLFIHGIGGAKYDQLTDAIIRKFWDCEPPEFMTITATMKLPFEFERVSEADLVRNRQQLRELRFHPEKHISTPDKNAMDLIATKKSWIDQLQPSGRNKQRHDAITHCNDELQHYVSEQAARIQLQQEQIRSLLSRSRILDARNYSFCCFDEGLVSALQGLASE